MEPVCKLGTSRHTVLFSRLVSFSPSVFYSTFHSSWRSRLYSLVVRSLYCETGGIQFNTCLGLWPENFLLPTQLLSGRSGYMTFHKRWKERVGLHLSHANPWRQTIMLAAPTPPIKLRVSFIFNCYIITILSYPLPRPLSQHCKQNTGKGVGISKVYASVDNPLMVFLHLWVAENASTIWRGQGDISTMSLQLFFWQDSLIQKGLMASCHFGRMLPGMLEGAIMLIFRRAGSQSVALHLQLEGPIGQQLFV